MDEQTLLIYSIVSIVLLPILTCLEFEIKNKWKKLHYDDKGLALVLFPINIILLAYLRIIGSIILVLVLWLIFRYLNRQVN